MKNTVTIKEIKFGNPYENAQGVMVYPVSITTNEPIKQFKFEKDQDDNDEKVIKDRRIIPNVNLSDFKELLTFPPISWIKNNPTSKEMDEKLEYSKLMEYVYSDQIQVLHGAKVTFEREEVKVKALDENKPKRDENGEVITDKDGVIQYEYLRDENGNIVENLVKFGKTTFTEVKLDDFAIELAKEFAKQRKMPIL